MVSYLWRKEGGLSGGYPLSSGTFVPFLQQCDAGLRSTVPGLYF